jgi:hypothetical protein
MSKRDRPLSVTSEEESDSTNSPKTPRRESYSQRSNTPTEIDVSPYGSPFDTYNRTPINNDNKTDKVINSGPTVVVDRQNGNYLYTKQPYTDENKLTTAMFGEYDNQPNKFVYDSVGNEFYIDSYENHRGERIYHPVPKEIKGKQLFGGRRQKSRNIKRSRKIKRRRRYKTIRRRRKY